MKFRVQMPAQPETQLTAQERLNQAVVRLRVHYGGKAGEERLLTTLLRSGGWVFKWSVIAAGLIGLEGVVLCALFATTDDWKLVATAMHSVTADGLNNWVHHDLLPMLCLGGAKLWALRVLAEMLAVGFSPVWPNGMFDARATPPASARD